MKANNVLLTYALDIANKLVHIDNVPNGLDCNCYCPYCHAQLVAKNKGKKKISHFAHYHAEDCGKAYETALHLLAKEILCERKVLMLPAYKNVRESQLIVFDEIEIEKRNDSTNIQPDIVGICREKRLLIEIKVSHAVDEIKKQKIVELRLPCIEVDISEIELDKQKLEAFLLDSTDNRIWINNPRMETIYIQRKKEKAEAKRIKRLRLKTEQKQKIQQYKQAHPQYRLLREERCDNCKYSSVQEKFLRWIGSFGEMPEWVSFVKNLTPRQIVEDELLHIEYTHTSNAAFVRDDRYKKHYIYPKEKEEISPIHHKTYRFFKSIYSYCFEQYDKKCEYCKADFEYDGEYYVACSNQKVDN